MFLKKSFLVSALIAASFQTAFAFDQAEMQADVEAQQIEGQEYATAEDFGFDVDAADAEYRGEGEVIGGIIGGIIGGLVGADQFDRHYPRGPRGPRGGGDVVCFAQNRRGETFRARGPNPRWAQERAIEKCYNRGSRSCRPAGCQPAGGRW